jgi:nicotinamide mononucleotide transporter PnuC
MTTPMAILAAIEWIKNTYQDTQEVKVHHVTKKQLATMWTLSILVTVLFYFILKSLDTANLVFSTISITTSFIAAYLTFRRTIYFGLAYAMNDIVLIVMWIMASLVNHEYIPVVVCFVVFFVNDIYGFINWIKIQKRQINCTKTD